MVPLGDMGVIILVLCALSSEGFEPYQVAYRIVGRDEVTDADASALPIISTMLQSSADLILKLAIASLVSVPS